MFDHPKWWQKSLDLRVNCASKSVTVKNTQLLFFSINHKFNHLLVQKLLETIFKLVVSGLHSLSQLLQNLQKKKGTK